MYPERKVVCRVRLVVPRAVLDGGLRKNGRLDFSAPLVRGGPPDLDLGVVVFRIDGVGFRGAEFEMKRNRTRRSQRGNLGSFEEELLESGWIRISADGHRDDNRGEQ